MNADHQVCTTGVYRKESRLPAALALMIAFALISTWNTVKANSGLAEYDQPWELCALCHSVDGNSHMAKFPKLAGQPAAYIQKQLHDFLQGKRTNDGGQMSSIVTEIDVADIESIAQWFASQEAPPPADADQDTSAGKQLYTDLGCSACHLTGEQVENDLRVPYLTSQHAQYLTKQLMDFQQGNRSHINVTSVKEKISALTENEINELVTYLAATARE